ncbi:hypothetical protein D3C80_1378590 [compost metagenome]
MRIANAVTTAIITIQPLPDVQPVHSQNRQPIEVAAQARSPLIIAWWPSADGRFTTTSPASISFSTALIPLLVCTPFATSR